MKWICEFCGITNYKADVPNPNIDMQFAVPITKKQTKDPRAIIVCLDISGSMNQDVKGVNNQEFWKSSID